MTDYHHVKIWPCQPRDTSSCQLNYTQNTPLTSHRCSPAQGACTAIQPFPSLRWRNGLGFLGQPNPQETSQASGSFYGPCEKEEEETFCFPSHLPTFIEGLHSGAELLANQRRNDTLLITTTVLTKCAFPIAPFTWLLFSPLPIHLN